VSHLVQIHTQVRDPVAISAACRRMQLAEPMFGKAKLFNAEAVGWLVQLPDWRYPAICDPVLGTIHYDNFQGRWGSPKHLDKFLQNYAIEKARLEARKSGHTVIEQHLEDGFVKLTVQVGAAA
jgi:hypothetical protein